MGDRLHRLRHQAVVRRHHQDDDVGDVRATRTHLRERLMARRVEEGDLRLVLQRDLVRADMLGDAARFAAHHVGAAQGIEQRRLAVIDMTHDRDDRRTRLQRLLGIVDRVVGQILVDIADARQVVAELRDEQLGGILVDRLRHGDGHAHLEQRLDEVGTLLSHAVGEFLHGDCLGDDHVADLLGLRLARTTGATTLLLTRTLQRGERSSACTIAIAERAVDGELARGATIVALAVTLLRTRGDGIAADATGRSICTGRTRTRGGRAGVAGRCRRCGSGSRNRLWRRRRALWTRHRREPARCRECRIAGQLDDGRRCRRCDRRRRRLGSRCRSRRDRCGRGLWCSDRSWGRRRSNGGFDRSRRRRRCRDRSGSRFDHGGRCGRRRLDRLRRLGFRLGPCTLGGAVTLVLDRLGPFGFLATTPFFQRVHALFFGLAEQLGLALLRRQITLLLTHGGGRRLRRARLRCRSGGRRSRGGRGNRGVRDLHVGLARTAQDARTLGFHDHRIRSAVAEALLHLAGLDRALHTQRCAHAKFRLLVVRVAHSNSSVMSTAGRCPVDPDAPIFCDADAPCEAVSQDTEEGSEPIKCSQRSSASLTRFAAARSVRPMCTTFSRPSANANMVRDTGSANPRKPEPSTSLPMRQA